MRLSLSILFLQVSCYLFAQADLHFTNHFVVKDGLSNTTVYVVRQDSRGFLWLGTKEGLNRFDGYRFKNYFKEKNNPQSLSHNLVNDILEYQPGHLLIATGSGLSVLNTLTGKFENDRITFAQLQAGSGTIVFSLYEDDQHQIWINHDGELDVFDKELNYLYRFTDQDWAVSLKGIYFNYEDWYTDQKGRLWLPSDTTGIQIIDFQNKKIFNQKNNPDHLSYLNHRYIRSFLLDEKNNTLWLGPWGEGLIKYNLITGQSDHEYFNISDFGEQRSINALVKTDEGALLCVINGKCYEIDPLTMHYKHVKTIDKAAGEKEQADDEQIYCITMLKSLDHQYWFGGNGLYQLQKESDQNYISFIPSGQSQECMDMLISSSGKIYSIYDNRWLVEMENIRSEVHHYIIPGNITRIPTELCEDPSHRIWIGTKEGIDIFDPDTKVFSTPSFLPQELMHSFINVLFTDQDGDIWIVTRAPFNVFRYQTATGETHKVDNEWIRRIATAGDNGRISSITQDADGRLWMASIVKGGIISFDKKTDSWSIYPKSAQNFTFLANKGIVSIQSGHPGLLWMSTVVGDGLVCYNYRSDQIVQYTREDGLLSDYVQNICTDAHDHLWLTSEYGVTQFSQQDNHVISNILLDQRAYVAQPYLEIFDERINKLVLGFSDGHIFISPDNISDASIPPFPFLDKVMVNHEEQFMNSDRPTLSLSHNQKNISIEFTSVHYSNADKLRFAYMLKGADEEWKLTDVNRTAEYSILHPGNYTFKVKVADENGKWGDSHDLLFFTIVPPFWATAWFIFGLSTVLILIAYWLFRKRIHAIRYEAGLKHKIAETEMMALRAQMNPHFIFNCINSIDALIQSNDKYLATIYLNKFAKLIRNILDSSKQNVVTLVKDLDTLKLYIELEQFRNENKFTFEIKADPSLLQDDFKIPPLIVQPYVENAILHGLRNRLDNEGHLSISLNRLDGHLQYIIEDNGVGRANTMNGHGDEKISYGMKMTSDRVKLFNQEENASVEITDLKDNGVAAGTKVEVILKIQ